MISEINSVLIHWKSNISGMIKHIQGGPKFHFLNLAYNSKTRDDREKQKVPLFVSLKESPRIGCQIFSISYNLKVLILKHEICSTMYYRSTNNWIFPFFIQGTNQLTLFFYILIIVISFTSDDRRDHRCYSLLRTKQSFITLSSTSL